MINTYVALATHFPLVNKVLATLTKTAVLDVPLPHYLNFIIKKLASQ
jgi:hypothetical protein